MLFVFTGNGKGKTTSAIGQALRAIGQGKKVFMLQFIKSRKFPAGEEKAIKQFGSKFVLLKGGKGFVGIMGDRLPRKVHQKAAQISLKKAREAIFSKKYDLVILDEINVALSLKLLTTKELLPLLKKLPDKIDIVLTGRYAPKTILAAADLVTEFKEVKHPFNKGALAKRGREY